MPKFIDRFMASQLRQPHGWFGSLVIARGMNRINRQIMEATLDLLDLQRNHHVLEIGFGGGLAVKELARRLNAGVVEGIDSSPDIVAAAKHRFAREIRECRVKVHLGDVVRLPFAEATFDRVFTINTIYFWSDVPKGISEIYRVLKPGGIAAIGIRSADKMRQHSVTNYNFRLFSGTEVAELMQCGGFHNVRIDHRDQEHWYDQVIVLGSR